MIDANQLRLWAQELGFAQTPFCSIEGFEKERALVETQQQLAERRQLRFFPEDVQAGLRCSLLRYAQKV